VASNNTTKVVFPVEVKASTTRGSDFSRLVSGDNVIKVVFALEGKGGWMVGGGIGF